MASGPTPQTRFEAWGEAVYRFAPDPKLYPKATAVGTYVIFAISDIKRQWLGWYTFNTSSAVDAAIMGYPSKTLGEKSAHPSHFMTEHPITVEELCGPILVSRGYKPSTSNLRQAFVRLTNHEQSEIAMTLKIHGPGSGPAYKTYTADYVTTKPIHLYIKRNPEFDRIYQIDLNDEYGWLTYIMAEPFSYPVKHINVTERQRYMRKMLSGPR
jgi:hypothetical protein